MTTTATPIETLAAPAALDRHVKAMTGDEPTLTDISAVLHLLGTHDVDPMRMQALCFLAARALGKFDADTRYAPPSELAEVVKDARQSCPADGCYEHVLPWIFDGQFCSPSCRNGYMRSQGATWVND